MESLKTERCTRRDLLRTVLEHAAKAGVEAVGRGLGREVAAGGQSVNAAGAGEFRQPGCEDASSREIKNTDGPLASGSRRGASKHRHLPDVRGVEKSDTVLVAVRKKRG